MKHPRSVSVGYGGLVQRWLFVLLSVMSLMVTTPAMARRINGGLAGGVLVPPVNAPAPVPPQFDLVGYLEEASVDPTMCPNLDPRLFGGHVKLNGQQITIPCNTILQMPAFAVSWADFFKQAPKDIMPAGSTESGLALADVMATGVDLLNTSWTVPAGAKTPAGAPSPQPNVYNAALPATEFHVVGNVIGSEYIAGLVFVSQQSLNAGQGVISCIDYATGEMQIGGTLQPHGTVTCPSPDPTTSTTITRVRMNDPVGRFGIVHGGPGSTADVIEPGFDPRFTADTDNPTMHSALGYPICIPSQNPINPIKDPITGATIPAGVDPLCPIYNRPVAPNCQSFNPLTLLPAFGGQAAGAYCSTWVMDPPGLHTALNPSATDPTVAAPLVIGDTIIFHGTMKSDANGPYISAHSIEANLGIYTQPHTKPSYVFVEALGVGTGGGTVGGIATESTNRVFWVGFSTDPTELVDFYSLHQDPLSGATTAFLQGTFDPCCVPLGRFRSPVNNIGVFGEPQRNYRAVSRTMCQTDPVIVGTANPANTPQLQVLCAMEPLTATVLNTRFNDPSILLGQPKSVRNQNNLVTGQFTLPNFDFIFGENLAFGGPIIPANLQDLPFLFCGSGPLDGPGTASPVVGQLIPAPWAAPMADPIFHTTYPNCATVASVGGAPAVTPPPPAPKVAVINSVTATPSILPAPAKASTTVVTLTATATNPNTPATPMSYAWTASAPPKGVTVSLSVSPGVPSTGSASVTATVTIAAGATAGPINFTVSVSNGVPPAATSTVTVTVPTAPTNVGQPKVNNVAVVAPNNLASGNLVTLNATAQSSPAGRPMSVSFTQVPAAGVPTVTLSPVTANAAGTVFTTSFTVPFGAPGGVTFNFTATATDTGAGVVSQAFKVSPIKATIAADTVTITTATYRPIVSRVGAPAELGKFNIVVTDNASNVVPAPAGMTMTAKVFNSTLPANIPGSSALPIIMPLLLTAADVPGQVTPVCGATPCWTGLVTGIIQDTRVTPAVLIAPDTITATSNLGGSQTIVTGNPVFTIR